ncbi:MAG TPA: F0F1 ATP synthase subunit gamma [Acidimicrobiia bacterium]|nr:F0F1 ATP synthase subunit gamma [Acidimicrobiia bacterium]
MAGGQERILRRRIRSVQSTKKITRAMELIAASRIVRAQARVEAAVPYSEQITEVVHDLADAGGAVDSPLLVPRPETRRVAHIVVTADRGLCGAYNSSILRATEGEMQEHRELGRESVLYVVGRKGESYFRFRNYPTAATFTGFSDQPSYEDARVIAAAVAEPFLAGEVDLVQVIYTRFVTVGFQEVVVRPLMPLDRETLRGEEEERPGEHDGQGARAAYEFEPGPEAILERLLPRYVEARVFAALLNAAASEHAARQRAMKAATDNADELIVGLTRVMNRARQDAITTEITEIVGGAEALRQLGGQGGEEPFGEDLRVHAYAE